MQELDPSKPEETRKELKKTLTRFNLYIIGGVLAVLGIVILFTNFDFASKIFTGDIAMTEPEKGCKLTGENYSNEELNALTQENVNYCVNQIHGDLECPKLDDAFGSFNVSNKISGAKSIQENDIEEFSNKYTQALANLYEEECTIDESFFAKKYEDVELNDTASYCPTNSFYVNDVNYVLITELQNILPATPFNGTYTHTCTPIEEIKSNDGATMASIEAEFVKDKNNCALLDDLVKDSNGTKYKMTLATYNLVQIRQGTLCSNPQPQCTFGTPEQQKEATSDQILNCYKDDPEIAAMSCQELADTYFDRLLKLKIFKTQLYTKEGTEDYWLNVVNAFRSLYKKNNCTPIDPRFTEYETSELDSIGNYCPNYTFYIDQTNHSKISDVNLSSIIAAGESGNVDLNKIHVCWPLSTDAAKPIDPDGSGTGQDAIKEFLNLSLYDLNSCSTLQTIKNNASLFKLSKTTTDHLDNLISSNACTQTTLACSALETSNINDIENEFTNTASPFLQGIKNKDSSSLVARLDQLGLGINSISPDCKAENEAKLCQSLIKSLNGNGFKPENFTDALNLTLTNFAKDSLKCDISSITTPQVVPDPTTPQFTSFSASPTTFKVGESINFQYQLNNKGNVVIEIYNSAGAKIYNNVDTNVEKDTLKVFAWTGIDSNASQVGTGLYTYKLQPSTTQALGTAKTGLITIGTATAQQPACNEGAITADGQKECKGGIWKSLGTNVSGGGTSGGSGTNGGGGTKQPTKCSENLKKNNDTEICKGGEWLKCTTANEGALSTDGAKVCADGIWTSKKEVENKNNQVVQITKDKAYPIGFNPLVNETKIEYKIDGTAKIELKIVNQAGVTVVTLIDDETIDKGSYFLWWDGTDSGDGGGNVLPSGQYSYKITAKDPDTDTVEDIKSGNINLLYQTVAFDFEDTPTGITGGFSGSTGSTGTITGSNTGATTGFTGSTSTANTFTPSIGSQNTAATLAIQNAQSGKTAGTGPEVILYGLITLAAIFARKKFKR